MIFGLVANMGVNYCSSGKFVCLVKCQGTK